MNERFDDTNDMLDIIGKDFECTTDNYAKNSTSLSKFQRRRRMKHERKLLKEKYICEFGTNVPLDSRSSDAVKLVSCNLNNLIATAGPGKYINTLTSGENRSLNHKLRGSRPLNPNNKKDLQRLMRLKRNLETLKRMAKHTNRNSFQTYKELPGRAVKLITKSDITIPKHDFILVPLMPDKPGQLSDKLWVAHQTLNTETNGLQIISTIIDKNVTVKNSISIYNLTDKEKMIKKGTLLCEAKQLHYSVLPIMDSVLIQEIEKHEPQINQVSADNLSPKAEKEAEFEASIKTVEDQELKEFLIQNKSVFVPSHDYILDKIDIPPIELGTIHEEIKPTPPPARRHFSDKHDEAISTHIAVGLMNGLIQRQQSPTVSPMHAVEQNGKIRIVMDSRKVNEQIEMYNYIFPKISEEVEELASGKFTLFSQTDLTSAFNQLEIHENSRYLLAFAVHTKKYRGTFAYTRLPFGIKPAPAIFASVLDRVLEGINSNANGRFLVKSFIDDIVIGAIDKRAMMEALQLLFARLICFNIKLSIVKSLFCKPTACYCGIEISSEGYAISPKRKRILEDYPDFDIRKRTKNNDLKYLGFYNWHRRFVENYSSHDREIRNIIKRYKRKELDADSANRDIKKITDIIKSKILKTMLITPTKTDVATLHCDASGDSWGYVLSCDRGVIGYGGGSFTETTQKSHNVFEKETMAMSNSLSDTYKLVSQAKALIIKNDNLSLITINKTNKFIVTPRMIKYLTNIVVLSQQLPSKFIHLNTLENYLADILSRLEYNDDGTIKINTFSDQDQIDHSSLYYINGINGREYVETSTGLDDHEMQIFDLHLKPKIESESDRELLDYYRRLHKTFHWSIEKTIKTCKAYGIPVNQDFIEEAWLECEFCQKFKRSAPLAKLKYRENPEGPFEEIHIDHIIKRNENKSIHGHTAALTVKCALTRYVMCFPVKDVQITQVVKELRNCFMITGRIPRRIYSDNAFDCTTMLKFCKDNKITIAFRASNLSRSVSVESTHRRLHEKVASMLGSKSKSHWHEVIWKAAMSLNCQTHDVVGFSPYYLFHGHQPKYLGASDVPCDVEQDTYWKYDLKIAKGLADTFRKSQSSDYTYPTYLPGDRLAIKIENTKNSKPMFGEIVEDKGGATALIKLDGRFKPIPFHKAMLYARKLSPEWIRLTGATRDFDDLRKLEDDSKDADETVEPIAKRLRKRLK